MSTEKVLITGSSGFLGHTLVSDYRNAFGSMIGVSRSSRATDNQKYKQYALDICSDEFVNVVIENDPSAIIHTAAKSIVQDCELNPREAFSQNVQGTINVLEAARRLKKDIPIVVLETDKVYGQQPPENIPTNESHPLLGFSPYEYSKVMTAQVCEFYRQYYGLKIYSLRPANIYGYWDGNFSRIVPGTFRRLLNGESPVVYNDSVRQEREYLFVDDLCDVIQGLLLHSSHIDAGPFNVSSGHVYSAEEVIKTIMNETKLAIPIKYVEKPFEFKEIKNQALSGDKLNGVLDFEFSDLQQGISKIWTRMRLRHDV